MSKFKKKCKDKLGFIIGSIGIGIVITFIVPIWGWMIAVGVGLIYVGWWLIQHHK